jgi:hypothetical protein
MRKKPQPQPQPQPQQPQPRLKPQVAVAVHSKRNNSSLAGGSAAGARLVRKEIQNVK